MNEKRLDGIDTRSTYQGKRFMDQEERLEYPRQEIKNNETNQRLTGLQLQAELPCFAMKAGVVKAISLACVRKTTSKAIHLEIPRMTQLVRPAPTMKDQSGLL